MERKEPFDFYKQKLKIGLFKYVISKTDYQKMVRSVEEKFRVYTYQDWLDGIQTPKNQCNTPDLDGLKSWKRIDPIDYDKIREEQIRAYSKALNDSFESLKKIFIAGFNDSFTKYRFLYWQIEQIKKEVQQYEKTQEPYLFYGIDINLNASYILTREQVERIFSFDFDSAEGFDQGPFELYYETEHPFSYIVNANFLKWLEWFQEKQKALDHIEPTIPSLSFPNTYNSLGASLYQRKHIKWENLFIEIEQANNILYLLKEYLSSTGQWLSEPKGRHLVALCTELESKGYFKSQSSISNPVKAIAFSTQFGVKLHPKNFQPEERNKAEDYREHFKHIPPYKPTLSA